ncbi:hypothetical protein ANRL4_01887 [Anaerolineae bacterium]|nr:hypothetical protein ANRL4_01887 [Anaerolineae bacterium]
MTEISNPIVQAVHDAIEAAVAATATELSQAVGFVGPATADQIRDRVEQLKNTIRQYLHWTSAAIPMMNAACAVRADPTLLPALLVAVDQYQARPAQPEPLLLYVLPAPSPWLNALDEAIAALDSGDDRYGEEVAGLERLRADLAGEGAPEIDAVWPKWPDTTEPMWASLLAQVEDALQGAEAEPDLVTNFADEASGADDLPGTELDVVREQSLEIEVLIEIDPHGLLTCTPPIGVRVRVLDQACQDGAETNLFTSNGEMERLPLAAADAVDAPRNQHAQAGELTVFRLCDPDHSPLACLIIPADQIDDSLITQLETQAARYGQIVIEDQGTDRADTPAQALAWIAQTNQRLGLAPTRSALAP